MWRGASRSGAAAILRHSLRQTRVNKRAVLDGLVGRSDCRCCGHPPRGVGFRAVVAEQRQAANAVGYASLRFSASFTSAGLPLPAIARITWPTKKPNSLSAPDLYSATLSAFAASTLATAASIALVSVT